MAPAAVAWAAEIASIPSASSIAAAEPADAEGRRALPGQEIAAGGGGSLDPARASGHA
jgi:hypothetical protein